MMGSSHPESKLLQMPEAFSETELHRVCWSGQKDGHLLSEEPKV